MLDLNIQWIPQKKGVNSATGTTGAPVSVERCLAVASELGYNVVALNFVVKGGGKPPSSPFTDAIMGELKKKFPGIRVILRRVTFVLDHDSSNMPSGLQGYDIVAVQPRTERALQQAATTLDVDLISLDMTTRLSFYLKHKIACAAVARGVRFEVCYAPSVSSGGSDEARRQCISNASSVFRATRNRGIVASSGAILPQSLRAPMDVVNLMTVWGLNSGKARESLDSQPREVVANGFLRSKSAKQAVVGIPSADQNQDLEVAAEPPTKKLRGH